MFGSLVKSALQRGLKTSPPLRTSTLDRELQKFKRLQAEFQCEDGLPIFLKRGVMDRVLYMSTLVGCVVGVAMCLMFLYDQAKPPSWAKACN